jgi:hypothetical protein
MKGFIKNHMFAIPLVTVLAIGVSGSALVWNATHTEQVAVQAPPAEASTVEWSKTPAAEAIRSTIAAVPKEWPRRGEQLSSVTPPFPLSCNVGGIQSSYSVSQQYNNGTTVALAAYTAGTGALAFETQREKSSSCVENNTAVSNVDESGIGADAFTIQVRRGGATSQTTVFRRGDVIGFVLVDGGASADPARVVDSLLATAMGGQCVKEDSTTDDAKRTLWSGEPFTGLLIDTNASIEAWKLPSAPANASYKATPLPAKVDQVVAVTMPDVPDYPVWPKLPEEKKAPELPKSPEPSHPTSKTVLTRVSDDKGPGCGWSFTGTVAPMFNASEVKASNDSIISAAQQELESGAAAWSKSVLAYWESIDKYTKSLEEYEEFRTEVIKVDEAWNPIHEQWKKYYTNLANYEDEVKARDDFIARKNDAQKSYDSAVQVCNAPEPTQSPTPTTRPTQSPSPSPVPTAPKPTPAPTVTPSAPPVDGATDSEMDRMTLITPMVRTGCPAERPAILNEKVPEMPTAPTKPENPIPEDKR